jgi:kojibiose phosphorylase
VIEQCVFLPTSRDKDPRIHEVGSDWNFDTLLQESESAWSQRWQSANIEIEGDKQADAALRYVVFELIANNSAKDSSVSIGARGLTHTRYKGCYFWDTDIFMMPFYLYTAPEAARNLMQYRTDALPQAKKHAQEMNCLGARYPWMASYDGSEQCESWDIGASELHVTADVVHALNQYVQATGDEKFYLHEAAKVYIETARFWQSRYSPELGTRKVNLLFCKGPDEYCGITSNNLYTNVLVKENLKLAQDAADYLYQYDRPAYLRLGITAEEVKCWNTLEHSIKLPKDPISGHWRQDDTFHLLEPIRLSDLKQGDTATYNRVCYDRLQRYRVIKQADVLLLMTRLPNMFTSEEKLAAWKDFEPLCLHDSTLSFASHALFAAQNGLMDAAQYYFKKAAFLDLRDVMENTGTEGLHLACLGETWQAAVIGFGGLTFQNGVPELKPHLPPDWKSMRFRFFYRGKQYEADLRQDHNSLREV